MAQKKTTVMGACYKDALEQKKKDSFRKQVLASAREVKRERHNTSPKRDSVAERQRKIAVLTKEINHYEAELKEAKAARENDLYGFFGVIALVIFGVLVIVGLVLYVRSSDRLGLLLLVSAVLVLAMSIISQNASMDAEKKTKEYTEKLKMLRRELNNLTKIPPLD